MKEWGHGLKWAAVVALFAGIFVPASALKAQSVIRVPADYPTIQAAIDAAVNGDTVLVAPGTYVENINFRGKAITVTSEQGPEVTIIDGNQAGSVVTLASGEGRSSVLSGFTVRNGSTTFEGGGINVQSSSPTIIGNIITNNRGCNGGGGIGIGFGSPLVQGNIITNNGQRLGCSGGIGGGGISVRGSSSAQILDNTISNNSWTSGHGGGISLFAAGTPTIKDNVIHGNSAAGISPCSQGGGITMVNLSDALIVQNLITGNTAGCGGGVHWLVPFGARGPFLVNNTIADNFSPQGSGVFADGFDAQTLLINNNVIGAAGQTAVFCGSFNDLNPPIFRFNNVFSPGGTAYGGICTDQSGMNGNISADPLFVNPANANYHLRFGSPSIEAGDNAAPDLPATDFDGDARILDGNGDGVAVVDMGVDEFALPAFITVAIDIQPGRFPNRINPLSQGKISVAILSAPDFGAPARVDRASLTFGRTGDEMSLAFCDAGPGDVNGDGLMDLICRFHTELTGFQAGDTEGILKGQTIESIPIEGRDSVTIQA